MQGMLQTSRIVSMIGVSGRTNTVERSSLLFHLALDTGDPFRHLPSVVSQSNYAASPSEEANQQGRHVPTILFTLELHQPRRQRP